MKEIDGKIYHTNTILKSLRNYINIKVDIRMRNITRDKEGYFILIKESTHQENINLNMHVPNNSFKLHGAKTDKTKRIRQIHNYICKFQYTSQ